MYSKLRLVIFVISCSPELTYPLSDDEKCHQNGQYYCKVSKECLNTEGEVPCGRTCGREDDFWNDRFYCEDSQKCLLQFGSVPCNTSCQHNNFLEYCPATSMCINEKTTACDGACSDDRMFLCDENKNCRNHAYVLRMIFDWD